MIEDLNWRVEQRFLGGGEATMRLQQNGARKTYKHFGFSLFYLFVTLNALGVYTSESEKELRTPMVRNETSVFVVPAIGILTCCPLLSGNTCSVELPELCLRTIALDPRLVWSTCGDGYGFTLSSPVIAALHRACALHTPKVTYMYFRSF